MTASKHFCKVLHQLIPLTLVHVSYSQKPQEALNAYAQQYHSIVAMGMLLTSNEHL
jgi:hypothetical protein